MKFFNRNSLKATHSAMPAWAKLTLSFCLLGLPLSAGVMLGVELAGGRFGLFVDESLADLKDDLSEQQKALESTKAIADEQIRSLSLKLADMQAKLIRLNALGERLTAMAELDADEFDFSISPSLGGPYHASTVENDSSPGLESFYQQLVTNMATSEQKLLLLESLYKENQFRSDNTITGRPIVKGWMSSPYGYRVDPFKGTRVWHNGVDFSGQEGADVVAVASGIVTRAERKPGYGILVELDHGEGFVTRYGHNKSNLVNVGDLVAKGQVISLMGHTGRATGPHVHFEVFKNGRSVDPASYIRRNHP